MERPPKHKESDLMSQTTSHNAINSTSWQKLAAMILKEFLPTELVLIETTPDGDFHVGIPAQIMRKLQDVEKSLSHVVCVLLKRCRPLTDDEEKAMMYQLRTLQDNHERGAS